MAQEDYSSTILHIVVVGFHHQRGTIVEYCYPPIKECILEEKPEGEVALPKQWQTLPYLSMPDGAHNYEEDSSFFHLPALTKGSKVSTDTIFGVSCFRQIDSKKLLKRDENTTRTQVQKSVCILMRIPLYGFLLAKLKLVTHAYFNELDFSKTEILQEFFDSMTLQLASMRLHDHLFHLGFGLQNVVVNFKQKILVLLKILLLEKKIAIWGNPVSNVCQFVLSLVNLFPGLIHKGLYHAVCVENTYRHAGTQAPHDQYGLPLDVFEEGCIFQPYVSLHNMTILRKPQVRSFVVGCSNVLFKQQMHCPWDVLVDIDTFTIDIPDPNLSKILDLSTEDLRYCEYIVDVVENSTESLGWEGSDDWLRLQFKAYLLCLLSTVSSTPEEELVDLHQFNGPFCHTWTGTNNYRRWSKTDHPGMEHFHVGHPFQGDITISDVKLRINIIAEKFANEETRKKISDVLNKTQVVVEEAYNTAKGAVSSAKGWISGLVQEIEDMQKPSGNMPVINNTNVDICSSNMIISDKERKGEAVKTIGDFINDDPAVLESTISE